MSRPAPSLLSHVALCLCLALTVACSDDGDNKTPSGGGDVADGTSGGDGGATDGTTGGEDGTTGGDTGGGTGEVEVCTGTPAPTTAPGDAGCAVEKTGSKGMLVVGDLLLPGGKVIAGGGVIIEGGKLTCVGCDCAKKATDHTWVLCPDAVVSPGLIDAHNHVGWLNGRPWVAAEAKVDPALRWEHRHDWRKGKRGNPKVSVSGGGASTDQKAFGELRYILTGGTSIFGSGDLSGLMRDLDATGSGDNGLGQPGAKYDTFPLGDSSGTQLTGGCGYGKVPDPTSSDAWAPHVAEGIDNAARNEFLCMTSQGEGSKDTLNGSAALIHGTGLNATDYALMAAKGAKLIWSPRSNVSLYGDTARVVTAARLGVSIGLGVDWVPSGSMNMVRELTCAAYLNDNHWGGYFKDWQLWEMATIGAARALAMDDAVGALVVGHAGDIAVFKRPAGVYHRAIIDAKASATLLVVRGGDVLAGNKALATKLDDSCESIGDVCGSEKAVCVSKHIGKSWADLKAKIGQPNYPLFACETPKDEPSCVPARTLKEDSVDGSNNYAGKSDPKDKDGDGIENDKDNCPDTFNPIRPLDGGKQADVDGDGVGDGCDPCPINADTTECKPVDPNDLDGDGIPALKDNCPQKGNSDQADKDKDGKGDVCDPCPDFANPGSGGCLATIPKIKTDAALMDQRVAVKGVAVTSVDGAGFFVQQAGGAVDHGGIYVYAGDEAKLPTRGAIIDIDGATVTTFYSQKQMQDPTWTDTGKTEATAPRLLDKAAAEQLASKDKFDSIHDGLLIQVKDVTVTDPAPAPGAGAQDAKNEFVITGGLRVDDANYSGDDYPAVKKDMLFAGITGTVAFRNDNMKLLPRDAKDINLGAPEVVGLSPDPVFQRAGAKGATLPQALTVTLSHAPEADTTVEVTVADTSIADVVGGPFVVKAGQTTVGVDIEGLKLGTTTVSANVKGSTKKISAPLTVLAADAVPEITSLTPGSVKIPTSSEAKITVTFAHPVPPLGLEVTVTLDPNDGSLGTAPTSLKVPGNATSATLTFKAGSKPATGKLTVAGKNSKSVTVEVVDPSSLSFDVSGWKVVQASSSKTWTIADGTKMTPGSTLIIARKADKAAFEKHWQVTLGADVVYINSNDKLPSINGDETFTLSDKAGKVVDGPTVKLAGGSTANYQRKLPVAKAGDATSWVTGSQSPGGPTPGTVAAGTAGIATPYISEFSDASGSGNFVYEFVELHLPLK